MSSRIREFLCSTHTYLCVSIIRVKRSRTWSSNATLHMVFPKGSAVHQHGSRAHETCVCWCSPKSVHSFWSRIVSPIPREQIFFLISSFGDRFVEYIYFFEDSTSSGIHIFDMHRKQEIIFKDFISYPTKFPFKDPSCLVRPDYTATEILQMHRWTLQRRNASCMGRRFLVEHRRSSNSISSFLFF